MPKSTECLNKKGRKRVNIREALRLSREERRSLVCVECGDRVRTHQISHSGTQAAHFEHLHRNMKCSLSDHRFR
jgi:hypothetical protein